MRLSLREKLANKFLLPVLDSLHPALIFSIFLFVVGLLCQLWSVTATMSGGSKSVLLNLISSIGTILTFAIAAITVVTLVHSVYNEESPFATATSNVIRRYIPNRYLTYLPTGYRWCEYFPLFCTTVTQMTETSHFDQISSVRLLTRGFFPWQIDELELTVQTTAHVLLSDASLKAKQTIMWNWLNIINMKDIANVEPERTKNCYQQLRSALISALMDTAPNQKNVKLVYVVSRMAILCRFSGVDLTLPKKD